MNPIETIIDIYTIFIQLAIAHPFWAVMIVCCVYSLSKAIVILTESSSE